MSVNSDNDDDPPKRRWRIWLNPTTTAQLLPGDPRRREQICDTIDDRGFGWQIWLVAGSGFFTESYNLFATNVILPSLAYIYWDGDDFSNHETKINLVTLGGSIVGQLTFGLLSDLLGRRKLYGFELIFVIFGTVGLAGCGTGFGNSMSIMGWLIYYRFFVGVGVGAEYPLAGVITSEFAPVQSRARMMVAVTLMQPLGQVAAAAVGLTVLTTLGKRRGLESLTESPQDHEVAAAIIDRIWRIVIGVGAIPAFLAIIARVTIPESPRFTLDVSHDGKQALKANQEYLGKRIFDNYDEPEGGSIHGSNAAHPAAGTPPPGSPPRAPSMREIQHVPIDYHEESERGSVHSSRAAHPATITSRSGSLHREPSMMEIQHAPMIGSDVAGESYQLENYNGSILHQGNGDVGVAGIFTEVNENGQLKEVDVRVNSHPRSGSVSPSSQSRDNDDDEDQNPFHDEPPAAPEDPHPFSWGELKKYFYTEGNWRQLAGISICWCCLDVAFYGLGIGDPRIVAQIWASSLASNNTGGLPMWGNPADPTLSIYDVLYQDSLHYIITISLGSLLGSFVLLKAIDYVPRKAALAWGFLALAATFAIVGGIYATVVYTNLHAFLITFYALLQLLFNLGPNTIIFLLAAELFPTRYRSTCFGIAAASGKLGSIIVQGVLPHVGVDVQNSSSMSRMLIAFAFVMALGSLFAWAWIPEVQYSRKPATVPTNVEAGPVVERTPEEVEEQKQRERCKGYKIPSKTLETLGKGRHSEDPDKRVGLRSNLKKAWQKLGSMFRS